MSVGYLMMLLLPVGQVSEGAVTATATIAAESLEVGQSYEFKLQVELGEGFSVSDAGVPKMLLQLEVPKGVKLLGKEYKSYKELAKHEFLEEPYERLIEPGESTISFKVTRQPKPNAEIGINLIAYTNASDGGDDRFIRKRLALPVKGGAVSTVPSDVSSKWGRNKTYGIGDKAGGFVLPSADGTKVSLKKYRDKKNVIVTTYRAHW